jgi:hypothetical protein
MKTLLVLLIVFPTIMMMCPRPYKYDSGTFSPTPQNLESFNSAYDDYNSSSPTIWERGPLCFSSNRNSKGGQFDIVYMLIETVFDRTNGQITVDEYTHNWSGEIELNAGLADAVTKINSDSSELGPFLLPMGLYYSDPVEYNQYVFLYSTGLSGNLDIKFTENVTSASYSESQDVVYLNSDKDDAYPSVNKDYSAIYFCSNRGGNFDIYKADINKNYGIVFELSDPTQKTITKMDVLSSGSEDKCPFVIGNLIVFTSNRQGGYGGYDLYYSKFSDGQWSDPVNFGDKINTEFNEYRPIVKAMIPGFKNDLMIFSSDRPGGKGGYDLYYVGIDRMTGLSWY